MPGSQYETPQHANTPHSTPSPAPASGRTREQAAKKGTSAIQIRGESESGGKLAA